MLSTFCASAFSDEIFIRFLENKKRNASNTVFWIHSFLLIEISWKLQKTVGPTSYLMTLSHDFAIFKFQPMIRCVRVCFASTPQIILSVHVDNNPYGSETKVYL